MILELLVFVLIVLIVLWLALYATRLLFAVPFGRMPEKMHERIVMALLVVAAIIVILYEVLNKL